MPPFLVTTPLVDRATAYKQRTHHQFIPGTGYMVHSGPPELDPLVHKGTKNCAPPAGTKDGSLHVLRPSHGAKPMKMIWIAAERAWASPHPAKGNRLAWTTDHLMKAGWEYLKAA